MSTERRIPAMMVSGQPKIGVDSFSELTPEKVQLRPVNATEFSSDAGGVNKVTIRIPAFGNSFLDTKKSFLSFRLGYTSATAASSTNTLKPCNGVPAFSRMVVKTSAGLVLDDVNDYHILSQLKACILPADEAFSPMEGRYTSSMLNGMLHQDQSAATNLHTIGEVYTHHFNTGVLSAATERWLPLFMMDGGAGFAFEIDLYLSDKSALFKTHGTIASPKWFMKDVTYNAELLRVDETLCRKYNQIACDADSEILIPFETMHTHSSLLNSGENQIRIHESATNLKNIWSVLLNTSDVGATSVNNAYSLIGGSRSTVPVEKFNGRLGSKWVYNSAVDSDTVMITHVKNALGLPDNRMIACDSQADNQMPLYQRTKFVAVLPFEYTAESYANGVSSNTPIELFVGMPTTYTSNNVQLHSFTQLGYNLSVKNGQVRYVEAKPGSGQVY